MKRSISLFSSLVLLMCFCACATSSIAQPADNSTNFRLFSSVPPLGWKDVIVPPVTVDSLYVVNGFNVSTIPISNFATASSLLNYTPLTTWNTGSAYLQSQFATYTPLITWQSGSLSLQSQINMMTSMVVWNSGSTFLQTQITNLQTATSGFPVVGQNAVISNEIADQIYVGDDVDGNAIYQDVLGLIKSNSLYLSLSATNSIDIQSVDISLSATSISQSFSQLTSFGNISHYGNFNANIPPVFPTSGGYSISGDKTGLKFFTQGSYGQEGLVLTTATTGPYYSIVNSTLTGNVVTLFSKPVNTGPNLDAGSIYFKTSGTISLVLNPIYYGIGDTKTTISSTSSVLFSAPTLSRTGSAVQPQELTILAQVQALVASASTTVDLSNYTTLPVWNSGSTYLSNLIATSTNPRIIVYGNGIASTYQGIVSQQIAIGDDAQANLGPDLAIGAHAAVGGGAGGVAIGVNAYTNGGVSVGPNSRAESQNGLTTAVGNSATVSISGNPGSSVAIGYASYANADGVFSIGNSSLLRRIVNVADGVNPTDAATVHQLSLISSATSGFPLVGNGVKLSNPVYGDVQFNVDSQDRKSVRFVTTGTHNTAAGYWPDNGIWFNFTSGSKSNYGLFFSPELNHMEIEFDYFSHAGSEAQFNHVSATAVTAENNNGGDNDVVRNIDLTSGNYLVLFIDNVPDGRTDFILKGAPRYYGEGSGSLYFGYVSSDPTHVVYPWQTWNGNAPMVFIQHSRNVSNNGYDSRNMMRLVNQSIAPLMSSWMTRLTSVVIVIDNRGGQYPRDMQWLLHWMGDDDYAGYHYWIRVRPQIYTYLPDVTGNNNN